MLRQKCFYKNDIETRKKPKNQRKNTTKVCNLSYLLKKNQ